MLSAAKHLGESRSFGLRPQDDAFPNLRGKPGYSGLCQ